jgi:DNA (cytosine-5)-methyltransferase 1
MIKTGVSLFAGIGGFDLAMERAGIKVVAAVEWDKHAQKVLAKQFPNSEIYGDITGVTGEQLINAGFDPANGIITGGFPCQDLSVAGRRAGLTGSRSGLFWEICRLLDETKAQNFILENVPGLLSSNEGRDMGTVIRALEERGYSIAWRVLDSRHFGVAQRRRRVFIVGNLGDDWRTPAEILALAESSARHSEQSNTKRKDPADSTTKSTADNSRAGNFELYDFPKESISPTLNARRAHDTMTYSEVARMQGFGEYEMDEISGALKARDYKDATDLVIEPTFFYAKNHQDVRIQGDVINTLAATMGTGGGNTPMVHAATVRRLTPTECERLQGFPDNWTEGQADSHRYKQLGNAVAVPVVEWIIKRFIQATN